MEFGLWEKYYIEILDDFGFSRENDEESAKLLDEILSTEGCLTLDDLSQIVGFSDKFIVFGAGPSLKEHILMLKEEYDLKDYVDKGEVPFGVHGWNKYFDSFEEMDKYLKEKGVWH